ncbi:MAG: hypothetical protein ACXADH_16340 [Candidatus Kariarchaeaceae archaeon]|jgi:hypothetical protein
MPETELTRTSRSDEGILALTNSVLHDILGLRDETRSLILKIIRNQGQWQDLKIAVRQMPGVAHRRLNDVINMSRQTVGVDREDGFDDEEDGTEDELGDKFGTREMDVRKEDPVKYEFQERRMRENKKVTFAGYLLNEVTYDETDLRDPAKQRDIQRLMRAGDDQAQQLIDRANRDQGQADRREVTQEQDPQRAQLMRRKQNLLKQVAEIDQQLSSKPGMQQQQARM